MAQMLPIRFQEHLQVNDRAELRSVQRARRWSRIELIFAVVSVKFQPATELLLRIIIIHYFYLRLDLFSELFKFDL